MGKLFSVLLLCAVLSAALLPGCSHADPALRGKWYDLNGDTVLEVGRSRLTLSRGKWSQSFSFIAETENGVTVLKGTKGNGDLGMLSPLTLLSDGSLSAYEMVYDADGHHYRFVREEAMAALLEIRDYSSAAPKVIGSHEIVSFSLSFRNDGQSYSLEDWPGGIYSWELETADGSRRLYLQAMGSSYIALDIAREVDESWMLGLDARIRELNIPQYNGYRFTNEVDRTGWSLRVEYASGEKLTLSAGGTAADTCPFDLAGLMEYVRPLAEESMR